MYRKLFPIVILSFALLGACKDDPVDPEPAVPTLLDATDPTDDGFTAHWETTDQPEKFTIDISRAEGNPPAFTLFFDIPGSLRSAILTGLQSNTTFQYVIRGVNGSNASAPSELDTVTTLPQPTMALEASNVGQTEFTARWSAVDGIQIYLLDIAIDQDFQNLLPEYQGREVFGTSFLVTGLMSGTTYYYRLRSKGKLASEYSNVVDVTTL